MHARISIRKHCMASDDSCETLPALYRKFVSENLKSVFPNVEIELGGFFMCMKVTNCIEGRSVSRLKLTKSDLRRTMGQQRLNWLSLTCIENEILKTIDSKPIINQFTAKKLCKHFVLINNN